jgi:hypothetical protein
MAEPAIAVAEAAAHALLGDDLLGRKPVLTGPAAVTQAAMLATIAEATGRPLHYRESTLVEFAGLIAAMGLPPELAASFIARYAALQGREPELTCEVEQVLGRPPRSYRDWVADNALAFAREPATRRATVR